MNSSLQTTGLLLAALMVPASAAGYQQSGYLSPGPALEVAQGIPARASISVEWNRPSRPLAREWDRFVGNNGSRWQSMWDQGTGVPLRIFGQGLPAPGAIASASNAEKHARALLASNIELLAPGSSPADFVVVSNEVHNGVRSVGFFQTWGGMRVVGGQLGFQFKNDRLVVMSSQALPHVAARIPSKLVQLQRATSSARDWVALNAARTAYKTSVFEGPLILPIVTSAGVHYQTVVRTRVSSDAPHGEWDVFVDAETGLAVARKQTLMFTTGNVLYHVHDRYPGGTSSDYPARNAEVLLGNSTLETSVDGTLSWIGDNPISVGLKTSGSLVRVNNDLGDDVVGDFIVNPDGAVIWDATDVSTIDAQLNAFIHARIVKEYARRFAPDLDFLNEQLPVNVNLDNSCNAFSNGTSINFFLSDENCENTGRLADVIYHEFGHSLHGHSVVEGIGVVDGAFGEGLSDYLAATINDDPAMGRGFFYTEKPLRDLDPEDKEYSWPEDIGEIHYTGLIFAGAMWDLRKIFIERLGKDAGVAYADRLFYAAVRSASDIPSSYVQVILEDDDDGDLANGTPNICDINAAFGKHGLRAVKADLSPLAREDISPKGHPLEIVLSGVYQQCPSDEITDVKLVWQLRSEPDATGTVSLDHIADLTYEGLVPTTESGVVNYRLEVAFADGGTQRYPNNPADQWLELYAGDTVELYCTDFDQEDPFENGWSHGLAAGEDVAGADDWQWGPPTSKPGTGDPGSAFSGSSVIGNDLGTGDSQDGFYKPNKVTYALSPVIDTGNYSDVRLHYRRWLNVEDAYFDKATIYANDRPAWQNLNSDHGDSSAIHHRDDGWRFHDVSLSSFITDGHVQVKYELDTDQGLHFGGWNIDDFCIVAASDAICGDGHLTGIETCDDGVLNSNTDADACRENCRVASCGDGVIDRGEQCDDGNTINDDGCSTVCEVKSDSGCGFNVTGENRSNGALVLLALLAVLARPRRRLRACN